MLEKKRATELGIAGAIIGILAVLSVKMGNPGNMGICIACFIRDTAGGLGLHRAAVVQYIRPEIIGIVLGAFLISNQSKEFKPKVGSSPLIRFIVGFFIMIGALMFLGCPTRMVLRLAGGDLNALWGLAGFIAGIALGMVFINRGYSLKRTYKSTKVEGAAFSIIQVVLLVLLVSGAGFILFSEEGPGSMHAPIWWALGVGLIVGIGAQKTRMCTAGAFRDVMMRKDYTLLTGIATTFVFALIVNFAIGKFNLGFAEQPIAHTDALWNFLGMTLVGLGSTLLGGCPLRQLILAGEGNIDSAITVLGLLVGAAFAHNFGLASSAKGPTGAGQVAVIIGFVVLFVIALGNSKKQQGFNK